MIIIDWLTRVNVRLWQLVKFLSLIKKVETSTFNSSIASGELCILTAKR